MPQNFQLRYIKLVNRLQKDPILLLFKKLLHCVFFVCLLVCLFVFVIYLKSSSGQTFVCGLLPTWLQQPWLGQANGRSKGLLPGLPHGCRIPGISGICCFHRYIIECRAPRAQTVTHIGCWHYTQGLNTLCQITGPRSHFSS